MTTLPLRYWVEIAGRAHRVREIRGFEAISKTWRLELRFTVEDGVELDPDDLVKTEASVRLEREGAVRSIDGVVTDVSLSAVLRGAPELTLVVEPRLALARYRTDIHIFRDKSVPDIVQEVLATIGVVPELRLRETYAPRAYCVQHRETDLDFVSRLLEDEGIFYYFLAGDKLVLGDSPAAYDTISGVPQVPFRGGGGMDMNEDAVNAVGARAALSVGKVTLRDWNPETPSLGMDVEARGPSQVGPEYYDFPGEYAEPGEGARKARLHAEAYRCASEALVGRSFCGRLVPGHTFELVLAPTGIDDGEYILTRVDHAWHRDRQGFTLDFEALDARIGFRPPRVTEAPRILNPVTGFVTGGGGDDIHTDEYGRVKVHMHWDRRQPFDDRCSDWIPVLQDNTGHSCAMPRVGWEVLVHFMEGDPDRPVVLGRTYNSEDNFPQRLPEGKTRSALKSLSSPTRDGTNEIQFEDIAGNEHLMFHAERDENIVVANDKSEHVMVDESMLVHHDDTIAIGANHTVEVGGNVVPAIDGNQSWTVGGNRSRFISSSSQGDVQGNRTHTIGGMHFRRIGMDDSVIANKLTETVGGVILEVSINANATEASKAMALTVGGAIVEIAKEDKTESASFGRVETIGGVVFSKAGESMQTRVQKNRITTVGGAFIAHAKKELILTGPEKLELASLTGSHTAATEMTLKVGETIVLLKDDLIKIVASGSISMKVDQENMQGSDESFQI